VGNLKLLLLPIKSKIHSKTGNNIKASHKSLQIISNP